ncbi:MAG: MaoC/PaaZ C-terminal domain-containing protein [Myxococcota bacterium]|nr:MaoC/PaaZ C-terminal domain-containing protein [Myxococcota bacterium]
MSRKIDFEGADAGSPIDGIAIPAMNRVTLARYAGAAEDYNAVHLDDKVAKASGKSSVYAPSTLVMAYIGRMVQAALEGASIRRYGLRVMKLLWPGDVLTCRGVVVETRKENGEYLVDMDVWADNQRGETAAKGRVLAVVPKDSESALTKASEAQGLVYKPADGFTAMDLKSKSNIAGSVKKATKKTAKKAAKKTTKKKTTKKS